LAKDAGANAITASPAATSVTPAPTRVTMPDTSIPKVGPQKPSSTASSGSKPIAYMTSRKFKPAACTSISTSSSAIESGSGSARHTRLRKRSRHRTVELHARAALFADCRCAKKTRLGGRGNACRIAARRGQQDLIFRIRAKNLLA